MKWQKLSSKKLFSHPRIELYEDTVKLPSGLETQYIHFGNTGDSAMIIARNHEGKILLQKEYSYPPDEVLYQFPGGSVNADEAPELGAKREFAEEAGLAGKLKPLGWYYSNNRRSPQRQFVFLATDLRPVTAEKDAEESFEDYWLTETEVEELIRSNEIRNITALSGWTLYKLNA